MRNKALWSFSLLFLPIVFLPGCAPWDWIKRTLGLDKKVIEQPAEFVKEEMKDDSKVLASLGGKPLITAKSLDESFDQLLEENPQLKAMLPLMPKVKWNFLQGMLNQAIVDKKIEDSKIDQQVEYQKEYERMMLSVKRMLNTKYFGLAHPVGVTDAEVKKFYEEHKDIMPDIIISRGGIKAVGVSFEKEEDAKSFFAKVKNVKEDFSKIAEETGLKVNDFKLVNKQSLGINSTLRDNIVALKKFPIVELYKIDDKTSWVVKAFEKEEPKYRPFEEVKANIEPYVVKEKRMEVFDKEIDKLKVVYDVVVHVDEEYFGEQEKEQMPVMDSEEMEEPEEEEEPITQAA